MMGPKLTISRTTLLAVVAVLLTVGALWLHNRPLPPKEVTWDDVVAESTRGNYQLLSTEALANLYQEAGDALLLIDARQEWEFRAGHIAGAINFPLEPTAWARWTRAGALQQVLGSDKDRLLVFY